MVGEQFSWQSAHSHAFCFHPCEEFAPPPYPQLSTEMSASQPGTSLSLSHADIVRHGQSLPPAPRIMARLGEMLKDLETDIGDIARTLKTDPALTTRVIRMSKAIMFGGASDIVDLEQALARVGFSNVLGLVGAASVTQFAPEPLQIYGIDVDTFQKCSLCHALAAESLARAVGEDPQAAYIAALLRGLGMVVLDRAAAETDWILEGEMFALSRHECYANYDLRVFGRTSSEVTRVLLEEWHFPANIVTAIGDHYLHGPEALSNRLACVLNVAGEIAAAAGNGFPGDDRHWSTAPEKYDVLGISYDFWGRLCEDANERFSTACQALKVA
jgi:HD-like signal output (HDOD) protein